MLTAEQRAARSLGVGSSDIPILLGVSPYAMSLHDIYMQKVYPDCYGEKPPTLAQKLGILVEPLVLEELADDLNWKVLPNTNVFVHPECAWARATPDAILFDAAGYMIPCEAKVPGYWALSGWGKDGEDIPDFVYAQLQWQMYVLEAPYGYAAAIFGNEFKRYRIARNEEVIKSLIAKAKWFWDTYVVAKCPPPVDGSEGATRMVDAMFPTAKKGSLVALHEGDELLNMGRLALERRDARDVAATAYEETRQQIKLALQETEKASVDDVELVGANVKISWSNTKTGRVLKVTRVESKAREEAA